MAKFRFREEFPTVFIPIEFLSRDFFPALLLASELLNAGMRTVVGYRNVLSRLIDDQKSSVWAGKADSDFVSENSNSTLVFFPDEGAIWDKGTWEAWMLRKYYAKDFADNHPFALLTWGQEQASIIRERYPSLEGILDVAGTPRFDFFFEDYRWVTDDDAKRIRAEFGDFVLFNTRFSLLNHPMGPSEAMRKLLWERTDDEYRDSQAQALAALWSDSLEAATVMIPAIRYVAESMPDTHFVVRPHPDENSDFYRHFLHGLKNVSVDSRYSSVAWIRAADRVVGSHCTTGIESALAGKAFVNVSPPFQEATAPRLRVVSDLGTIVTSRTELAAAVETPNPAPTMGLEEAMGIIDNFERPSAPRIASTIESVFAAGLQHPSRFSGPREVEPRRWGYKREPYKALPISQAFLGSALASLDQSGTKYRERGSTEYYFVLEPN